MASPIWHPLNAERKEIRICRLSPSNDLDEPPSVTLEIVSLDSNPEYEALSYTWGDPKDTTPIMINGVEWPVTTNLDTAFRYLRSDVHEKRIWADAICINQAHASERSAQVLLMGKVYSKAAVVRIWLGEAAGESDKAFEILSDLGNGISLYDIKVNGKLLTDLDLHCLKCLAERTWWWRVWVVQEAILAKTAMLHCGRKEIDLAKVFKAYDTALNDSIIRIGERVQRFLGDDYLDIFGPSGSLSEVIGRLKMIQNCRSQDEFGFPNFVGFLARCRSLHATDDRDKIYGLLGLEPQLDGFIEVNYSESVADVYVKAAFQMANQLKTLEIFSQAQLSKHARHNLPSWAPDWSISSQELNTAARRMGLAGWFSACGIEPVYVDLVGSRTLKLKGFFIDSVIKTGVPMEDSGDIAHVYEIFSQWRTLVGIESRHRSTYIAGGSLDTAFWLTLSNSILTSTSDGDDTWRWCKPSDYADYLRWWKSVEATVRGSWPGWTPTLTNIGDVIVSRTNHRRIMVAKKGYIGLGRTDLQPGDLVYILAGGTQPYALRPLPLASRPNTFELIGECYIHGLMLGEAITGKPVKTKDTIRRWVFGGHRQDPKLGKREFEDIFLE
jgi:hypothetical protein